MTRQSGAVVRRMVVFPAARDNPASMTKTSIFPRGLRFGLSGLFCAFGLLVASAPAWPQAAADPDAELRAKKPFHEQRIQQIESERLAFQRDLAGREEACLKRFFSSRCMDQIRSEHLREMRDFDLRKEAELQALRDIDAVIRSRTRERRLDDKSEKKS